MKRVTYYILSFTWGLINTLLGFIVALPLLICGRYRKRYCGQFVFAVGKQWGAFSIGLTCVCCKECLNSNAILKHEFGHSVQATVFGPLYLFVIALPSAIRYWYREFRMMLNDRFPSPTYHMPAYDSIWFEYDATSIGQFVSLTWYDCTK